MDPILHSIISKYDSSRSILLKYSVVEILSGSYYMQDMYASKVNDSVADFYNTSNNIYIHGNPSGLKQELYDYKNRYVVENQTYFSILVSRVFLKGTKNLIRHATHKNVRGYKRITCKYNKLFMFILERLLSSNRGISSKSILMEYKDIVGVHEEDTTILLMLEDFYQSVGDTDMFLLRNKNVGIFPKTAFDTYFLVHSNATI